VPALLALAGLVAIPAVSGAAPARGDRTLVVAVSPRSGSGRTHFVIRFRPGETSGKPGSAQRSYRVTASDRRRAGCQASVSAALPSVSTGMPVSVTLSPRRSRRWCVGTFRGQVWAVPTEPCPEGEACPAIVPLPRMVGRFTFRVTRR
jgi:hypothetical protein